MTANLTKIASLPGSGAGCVSALQAEVNEQPVKVQMKAAYFEEPKEEPLPKIDTIDEMATKLLKAVQGGQ